MFEHTEMRLVALVVVCGLIVGEDGGNVGAALPGFDSAQRTHVTGGKLIILLLKTRGRVPCPVYSYPST